MAAAFVAQRSQIKKYADSHFSSQECFVLIEIFLKNEVAVPFHFGEEMKNIVHHYTLTSFFFYIAKRHVL